MTALLNLKHSLNKGGNIKLVSELNTFLRIKLSRNSVSGKQSTHLTFNTGVVTWSFMQINYVNIVWWQEYLSCISDNPRSAEKEKFAAAAWQCSRKLITQWRVSERLQRLFFCMWFGKDETFASGFS